MEDRIHYPVRTVRLPDETWDNLKEERAKSGKTWNLFFVELLKAYKKKDV